jgi:hypothetical protein
MDRMEQCACQQAQFDKKGTLLLDNVCAAGACPISEKGEKQEAF